MSVEGGTEDQKTIFYTSMYHALVDPRIYSDVNGDYPGADGKVHQAKGFIKRTVFSGWDIYRSQFPLLTIIAPDIVNDHINSTISLADRTGTHYFDRWEMINSYTGCMCGSPQVVVMNDAYQKGIRNFDVTKGTATASIPSSTTATEQRGIWPAATDSPLRWKTMAPVGISRSWPRPWEKRRTPKNTLPILSTTSYFLTQCALDLREIGRDRPSRLERVVQRQDKAGNWAAWDGLTGGTGGMESSIFQTGWFVPQDIPGLITLLGGKELFVAKLADFFDHTPKLNKWNPYENQANEPSHLIPFLFNRAGAPWLTQKWVRRLCTEAYGACANGLSGDDDEGQVSAWFVLGASGLAQACPGDPRYEIFTPLFDKVTLNLHPKYATGKAFVVTAKNNTPENVYIQSARLNGQSIDRCWLNYSEISAGGTLELVLGPQPNKNWGIR